MPMIDKELNAASEAFLQALDAAPFTGILKNQEAKDWLETLALRAFASSMRPTTITRISESLSGGTRSDSKNILRP